MNEAKLNYFCLVLQMSIVFAPEGKCDVFTTLFLKVTFWRCYRQPEFWGNVFLKHEGNFFFCVCGEQPLHVGLIPASFFDQAPSP